METSQSIKVGDIVRIKSGNKLFVGESDLESCEGLVFIVTAIPQRPVDYPLFCKPHPMYRDVVPKSIKKGICFTYEEVELVE